MKDNAANKDVFRQMDVLAKERIPGISHMTWTLRHLLEHYETEYATHAMLAVALDEYAQDTATITGTIRKEMAARKAGETLYAPRSGAG